MRAAAVAGPSGAVASIATPAAHCNPAAIRGAASTGRRCLEDRRPLRIGGELLGLATAQRSGYRPGGVGRIAAPVRQAGAIGYASPRAANRKILLPTAR